MLDVLQGQLRFIYELPDYIINNFIVRTCPHDYGRSQYDRFNDKHAK